jgi:hypothetical protein
MTRGLISYAVSNRSRPFAVGYDKPGIPQDQRNQISEIVNIVDIRIRIGAGECHWQRGGLPRNSFRHVHEVIEVALVGARPLHHPSGIVADVCNMFQRKRARHRHAPTRERRYRELGG